MAWPSNLKSLAEFWPVTVSMWPPICCSQQQEDQESCKTSSRHCSLKSEFELAAKLGLQSNWKGGFFLYIIRGELRRCRMMYGRHVDSLRWFSAKKFVRAMIRKWLVKKNFSPEAGRQGKPFLIRTWLENSQNNPQSAKTQGHYWV